MTRRIAAIASLLSLAILLASRPTGGVARDQGLVDVPPMLVTAPVVAARISDAEADPDLPGEAKSKLVALYRKALSNLQEVETHRARADAFAELTRMAPEQTRRLRERTAAGPSADAPQALGVSPDAPLDQLESQLKQAQADQAAADARRAELGRQLTYQQGRPALIRQRLTAAQADTARIVRATAHGDPAVAGLAGQNAAFIAELETIAEQADRLHAEQQQAERLWARTQASFERMQTAKAIGIPTEGLGQILLEQRATLPDFDRYARRARDLGQQIAEVNLSRLRHQEERERLADHAPAGAPPATGTQAGDAAAASPDLRDQLAEQRQVLLDQLLEAEGKYLERLRNLRTTEAGMIETARAYDAFLNEQLFWLPTGARTRLVDLAKLPDEVRAFLSPERWTELAPRWRRAVTASPVFWLALLSAAVLVWRRRALIAAIQATAAPLAHPSTDGFRYTLKALLLTLAVAAPLPLVLGLSGWRLLGTAQGSGLSLSLGESLVRVALSLCVLLVLRAICLPGGLAIRHFRWAEPDVQRFDRELRWFTWAAVPMIFVLHTAYSLSPATAGGLINRVGLLMVAAAMGLFFYRLLHPNGGILERQRQNTDAGLLYRAYWLWFPLLMAFPMLLVVLIWSGYIVTTHILANAFSITLGLISALLVVHALAVRALTLTHRRLALRAAQQRRQAALAAREQGPSSEAETADLTPDDVADLDLDAASTDSLELLGSATTLVALIGLYLIWSAVFPALGVLDEVTLWHSTVTLNGEARSLPITLADLSLALVYLGAAAVLARRLPALLNMILAQRSQVTAGSRYAITTLTTYAIVAIGTLLALKTIGAQWSQLQWLVAALSVGIGFGLQEIVANFISGLIILFERPIRVGDIVTVGNTDGMVTRIRIRATTIRTADRKELLVPNKEFITGRLLNWTLSDQLTRVMVTVRVAYGTDVERAHALMRAAAQEHERVLKDPQPSLGFDDFGDNSLTLTLRAFIDDLDYRTSTITDLHKAIYAKFQQAGIGIGAPQQDLYLDTREPLRVSLGAMHPDRPDGGNLHPTSKDL